MGHWRLAFAALLIAVVAGIAGGLATRWLSPVELSAVEARSASLTPGLDYIDAYECAPGLTKRVLMRGMEDGFSRSGDESAVVRPELMANLAVAQMVERAVPGGPVARNYDERGKDKHHLDQFEVPRGILSGELVLAVAPQGNNDNDVISLGDRNEFIAPDRFKTTTDFAVPIADTPGDGLLTLPLSSFARAPIGDFRGTLIDFLNWRGRPDAIDLSVAEDTMVDFAALVLCLEPDEARGTALREYRTKTALEELSFLVCGQDGLAPLCAPHSGHLSCSASTPVACYKPGTRRAPLPPDDAVVPMRFFAPGEVRLSDPVVGNSLARLTDANNVCSAQFGEGWRVLSFHEGGGAAVVSYSNIPPNAQGLVHVADRPYGNCWDRPESVVRD